MTRHRVSYCCLLLVATASPGCFHLGQEPLPGEGEDLGKTVIYRDTWGVPHIYAPSVEKALFAQGYAQAQDRPQQLLLNLLMGIGEYASVAGEDAIPVDLRAHMWDHYRLASNSYSHLEPVIRAHLEAFVSGINRFYEDHPEDRPAWWMDRLVDPSMVIAFGRAFLFNWSIDEAYGDLRRSGIDPRQSPVQRGSNQFAISGSRSAEGVAILAIDPHLDWTGPSRFWEFRVHAGDWHGSGVTLAGSPYIGLGHTRHLAWAMTTGGPDTADVYELELHPTDESLYRHEGEWRELNSRKITLAVKGQAPQEHTLWFSHHGPLIARKGDRAYAARVAYEDVFETGSTWLELNFATDYRGAVRAMESLNVFPQNVMIADTSGNIYYQRTGRVPVRPRGFDWSRAVDGSNAASEWQGIHPASDLLQILNPPSGYMQNCNIPPDAMIANDPYSLKDFTPYFYGSRQYGPLSGWTSQRGARAVHLLSQDDSVTVEEAMAYINDIQPFGARRWIEVLEQAHQRFGSRFQAEPLYSEGMEDILKWDRRLASDSTGALKYAYWRDAIVARMGREPSREIAARIDDFYWVIRGDLPQRIQLADQTLEAFVDSFNAAMAKMEKNHGSLGARYGDRYRVGRGQDSWPLGGGGDNGTTTLRNVGYGSEREDRTRWGRRGQTSTQVVVMTTPPRSWIYLPLGQSDRPESPHFSDQAEKLFSARKLKPSWWLPEELAGHIESRMELSQIPVQRR